jgi:hypothetical protein
MYLNARHLAFVNLEILCGVMLGTRVRDVKAKKGLRDVILVGPLSMVVELKSFFSMLIVHITTEVNFSCFM